MVCSSTGTDRHCELLLKTSAVSWLRRLTGLLLAAVALYFAVHKDAIAQNQPSQVERWSLVPDLPAFPVHVHVLPTGKVMLWGYGNVTRLWDPAKHTTNALARPNYDPFLFRPFVLGRWSIIGDGRTCFRRRWGCQCEHL
jgi:hypothetical protein